MNQLRKFIRLKNWPEFFGYSPTQIENKNQVWRIANALQVVCQRPGKRLF